MKQDGWSHLIGPIPTTRDIQTKEVTRDSRKQPDQSHRYVDLTTGSDQYEAPQTYHPNGTVQNRQITSQEYRRVENNRFLNDSILNVTIQQIVAANPEYYAFSTYFMHTNLTNNTINPARAQQWKTTLNRLQPPPLHLLIPTHHNRNHWLYIHVDLHAQAIHQMDSAPNVTRHDYIPVTTVLLGHLYPPHRCWTHTRDRSQLQNNTTDCGMYVLRNIQHTLLPNCQNNQSPSRRRLLRYLVTGNAEQIFTTIGQRGSGEQHILENCRRNDSSGHMTHVPEEHTPDLTGTSTGPTSGIYERENTHNKIAPHGGRRRLWAKFLRTPFEQATEERGNPPNPTAQPRGHRRLYANTLSNHLNSVSEDAPEITGVRATVPNLLNTHKDPPRPIHTPFAPPIVKRTNQGKQKPTRDPRTSSRGLNKPTLTPHAWFSQWTTIPRPPAPDPTRHTPPIKITPHPDNQGMELHFGHILEEKSEDTFRIFTQNINGIKRDPTHPNKHFTTLLQAMTDRQVDLFGWSETNTEWTNYHTNNQLYKAFKQEFKGGKWVPVTSTIIFPSYHKPGGNLVGCNNRTSSRCLQQVKDTLGRWAGLLLQGNKRKLLILQLYIPIKAEGVYTTYTQQRQQLDNSHRHEESVHEAYFKDLQQLLNQHPHSEKLLMGDFNSKPTDKLVADLQTEYQLHDLYAHFHSVTNFNTHRDRSKQIDYVLTSKGIMYSTRRIGYEGNSFLPPSDHGAMFVDIHTTIFRNTTTPFRCNLNSKNASTVYVYRKKLNPYLQKTQVLSRLAKLANKPPHTWQP